MNYEYTIDDQKKVAYLTISEHCTIRDLENIFRAFTGDERFDFEFDVLADLRDCSLAIQPDEMSEFFRMYNSQAEGKRGKSAILVSQPHETALALLLQMKVSETRTIEVFSTRDAALKWLNEVGDRTDDYLGSSKGPVPWK